MAESTNDALLSPTPTIRHVFYPNVPPPGDAEINKARADAEAAAAHVKSLDASALAYDQATADDERDATEDKQIFRAEKNRTLVQNQQEYDDGVAKLKTELKQKNAAANEICKNHCLTRDRESVQYRSDLLTTYDIEGSLAEHKTKLTLAKAKESRLHGRFLQLQSARNDRAKAHTAKKKRFRFLASPSGSRRQLIDPMFGGPTPTRAQRQSVDHTLLEPVERTPGGPTPLRTQRQPADQTLLGGPTPTRLYRNSVERNLVEGSHAVPSGLRIDTTEDALGSSESPKRCRSPLAKAAKGAAKGMKRATGAVKRTVLSISPIKKKTKKAGPYASLSMSEIRDIICEQLQIDPTMAAIREIKGTKLDALVKKLIKGGINESKRYLADVKALDEQPEADNRFKFMWNHCDCGGPAALQLLNGKNFSIGQKRTYFALMLGFSVGDCKYGDMERLKAKQKVHRAYHDEMIAAWEEEYGTN